MAARLEGAIYGFSYVVIVSVRVIQSTPMCCNANRAGRPFRHVCFNEILGCATVVRGIITLTGMLMLLLCFSVQHNETRYSKGLLTHKCTHIGTLSSWQRPCVTCSGSGIAPTWCKATGSSLRLTASGPLPSSLPYLAGWKFFGGSCGGKFISTPFKWHSYGNSSLHTKHIDHVWP